MCDECNTVWLTPNNTTLEASLYPQPPLFQVPTLDCSIQRPSSRWANLEEVKHQKWEDYIIGEGKALDE